MLEVGRDYRVGIGGTLGESYLQFALLPQHRSMRGLKQAYMEVAEATANIKMIRYTETKIINQLKDYLDATDKDFKYEDIIWVRKENKYIKYKPNSW